MRKIHPTHTFLVQNLCSEYDDFIIFFLFYLKPNFCGLRHIIKFLFAYQNGPFKRASFARIRPTYSPIYSIFNNGVSSQDRRSSNCLPKTSRHYKIPLTLKSVQGNYLKAFIVGKLFNGIWQYFVKVDTCLFEHKLPFFDSQFCSNLSLPLVSYTRACTASWLETTIWLIFT